jgi:hypothetical protein
LPACGLICVASAKVIVALGGSGRGAAGAIVGAGKGRIDGDCALMAFPELRMIAAAVANMLKRDFMTLLLRHLRRF